MESLRRELKKIFKKALTKAARVIRDAVKSDAEAVARTGYLEKSIGIRIRTYGNSVIAVIGPRTGKRWVTGTRVRGKHKGAEIVIAPSKYLHLLEKGTKRARAKPVLGPAKQSTEGQFMQILCEEIRQGIQDTLK